MPSVDALARSQPSGGQADRSPAGDGQSSSFEGSVQEIGRDLEAGMGRRAGPGRWVDDRLMAWVRRRPDVRAALFRFTDVAPACATLDEAGSHLRALLDEVDAPPPSVALAARLARTGIGRRAAGAAAMAGVRRMGRRFILAADPEAAIEPMGGLWRSGCAGMLDLLGETTVSETEADAYAARCRSALETLARGSRAWPAQEVLERDAVGALPRAHLSIKLSALTPDLRPEAPERGVAGARERLRELLRLARDLGAHLHLDMELLDHRDAVLHSLLELLAEDEFRAGPSAGLVHQAYLTDSAESLETVLDWAAATPRDQPLLVRLVKGAYWDHEVVEAAQNGWPTPVFVDRGECDRNFEAVTARLIDAYPLVRTAVASHNLRSVAHALARQRAGGLGTADVEYQVLHGLGDEMRSGLTRLGARVRVYCPVGDLVSGMAYLVRRLLENTANDSFLTARQAGEDVDSLLQPP